MAEAILIILFAVPTLGYAKFQVDEQGSYECCIDNARGSYIDDLVNKLGYILIDASKPGANRVDLDLDNSWLFHELPKARRVLEDRRQNKGDEYQGKSDERQGDAKKLDIEADESIFGQSRNTSYYVSGSWSGWKFEEMLPDISTSPTRSIEIILDKQKGEFQIVRNRDWQQRLHPESKCGRNNSVASLDPYGHGFNWCIIGHPGDVYRILLRRCQLKEKGNAQMVVLWRVVRQGNSWDASSPGSALVTGMQTGSAQQLVKMLLSMGNKHPSMKEHMILEMSSQLYEAERARLPQTYARFQLTPVQGTMNYCVSLMGCAAENTLNWYGGQEPIPQAPHPCWLIPTNDGTAVEIAKRQFELKEAGWKIISSEPQLVEHLNHKSLFQSYAERVGLSAYLPRHFTTLEKATYPCILKPVLGVAGIDTHIVESSGAAQKILGNASQLEEKWVMQEFVPGRFEYSTAVLVEYGKILDYACIMYEFDHEVYFWPRTKACSKSVCPRLPREHLDIMHRLLVNYSGFCNFNYKLRRNGQLCIFEVNPRIGCDLAGDVCRLKPKLARRIFEKLDSLGRGRSEAVSQEEDKEDDEERRFADLIDDSRMEELVNMLRQAK